eukprot:CAMPEP_0169478670 /NCGR_PEP_ID=MMETSP1042-20121227/28597_1 /TAXON_ID=464988 /ORGANISM="Hemiselmis andersenii, Strain CCMP1180" /LENGTH=50 /DNA_ID=CAMNT_0009593149 /DNA_START=1 /DNA_END=150 /DNA_ORIENTATION=+
MQVLRDCTTPQDTLECLSKAEALGLRDFDHRLLSLALHRVAWGVHSATGK